MQSSSDAQISQLLSLIANLQDEKDSLEDELNIVKTSLVQLQVDVTGLTGENNSLLDTITSLTAQIEALEQTLATFNNASNSLYLDENGITIKAYDWAEVGDKGIIDGVEYTFVDEATLRQMVANKPDI